MRAPSLMGVFLSLAVLGLLFGVIERCFRSRPGPSWFRRPGRGTDLTWWLFVPFVNKAITAVGVTAAILFAAVLAGYPLESFGAAAATGGFPDLSLFGLRSLLDQLPLALQILLGFFVGDFIGYWTHRWFHGRRLWGFHAVHHSSEHLDWLSSVRVHPVNELVSRTIGAAPLLLLGFDPLVFAVFAPVTTLYAILLHANVDWRYGPFRFVLASPAFHRWHHSAEREARDTNFAGLFPVIDLMFGTYRLPERAPDRFGAPDAGVPAGFLGQLLHPFRRRAVPRPGAP